MQPFEWSMAADVLEHPRSAGRIVPRFEELTADKLGKAGLPDSHGWLSKLWSLFGSLL